MLNIDTLQLSETLDANNNTWNDFGMHCFSLCLSCIGFVLFSYEEDDFFCEGIIHVKRKNKIK